MNILLTSAGRRSYIVDYFRSEFPKESKIFASNSEYTIALQKADDFVITPMIYGDGYIEALLDFCRKNRVKFLISLFDLDLLVLAKHSDDFSRHGVDLILGSYETVVNCNDKWRTHHLFRQLGLNTPQTFIDKRQVDLQLANGSLHFPLVVKPRWGAASIGVYFAEDSTELDVLIKKCQREIQSSYLKHESSLSSDGSVLIQEKIIGDEHALVIVNDLSSQYAGCFLMNKFSMRSGETDLGVTLPAINFVSTASLIAGAIKQKGMISCDFFIDSQGRRLFSEINCRIAGTYPIGHLAGFNYVRMLRKWIFNEKVESDDFSYEAGVKVVKDLHPTILA